MKCRKRSFIFVIGAFLTALAGCASSSTHENPELILAAPRIAVPEWKKVTILVRPFRVADLELLPDRAPRSVRYSELLERQMTPENKNIAKFRSEFLAVKCAEALRASPWVKAAYFSTVASPSADFEVSGTVLPLTPGSTESVQLEVHPLGGSMLAFYKEETIRTRYYTHTARVGPALVASIDLQSEAMTRASDPEALLWIGAINALDARLAARTVDDCRTIQHERMVAYMGDRHAGNLSDSRLETLVKSAVDIETKTFLKPIHERATAYADALTPAYNKWLQERGATARRVEEEQDRAESESRNAVVLGTAQAFAAKVSNPGAAGLTEGLEIAQSTQNEVNAVRNRSQALLDLAGSQAARLNSAFAQAAVPTEITFDERIYALTGSSDAQLSQFRAIVLSRLNAVNLGPLPPETVNKISGDGIH